jgi:glycosyltransferase involved in cell wall biosynthesis
MKPDGVSRRPGLVSIVVPAYQAEKGLARCIESVLAQTYCDIQLIVVNDGSTDGTEDIALSFGHRITYLRQENRGETAARNRGLEIASGEFVTFLDHDDYWDPEFLQVCVAVLRRHHEVIGVSAGAEVRSALSNEVSVRPAALAKGVFRERDLVLVNDFFDFWQRHDHICSGSAVIRGSAIDEGGLQREDLTLSGDLEYWAYLATFGEWGFIPRVLLHVDGTQVQRGGLYRKFYRRYMKAPSVEEWQQRIVPRLKPPQASGFERVRGRVATWLIFAKVFVGDDREGLRMAQEYRAHLHGKFGVLWRLGSALGIASWKPMCAAVRLRTRVQYSLRGRKL